MYTPTKKELEEFGFEESHYEFRYTFDKFDNSIFITSYWFEYLENWYKERLKWHWYLWNNFDIPIYPQSLEDLKTLIRILTPQ